MAHGGGAAEAARLIGVPTSKILDFSASLNPFGPPPEASRALSSLDGEISRYPDPFARAFAEAAAATVGRPAETVLPGNGCTELIFLAPRAFRPGRVLVPVPSYPDYRRAAALLGRPPRTFRIPLEGEIPWERLWRKNLRGGEMVFVGNPNNPTGRAEPAERIRGWARAHRDSLFVVDESFVELLPFPEPFTLLGGPIPPNVLVLRSLTKTYAIPGLRLGYAAGPPGLIRRLRAAKEPWTVNGAAIRVGLACLKAREFVARSRAGIAREGRELFRSLAALPGLRPLPGPANFFLVGAGGRARSVLALGERLLRRGILVRDGLNFGGLAGEWFRVAVRRPPENARLVAALAGELST